MTGFSVKITGGFVQGTSAQPFALAQNPSFFRTCQKSLHDGWFIRFVLPGFRGFGTFRAQRPYEGRICLHLGRLAKADSA